MSSMVKAPKKAAAAKPKMSRPNPARAINDRDWRRKQMADFNASKASSSAGSPPPSSAGPPITARSNCPNSRCSAPNVVDGTCQSCGAVVDDSNIVSDVQFGEGSNGQAFAFGVTVGAGQAGPRFGGPGFGPRRVAGGGDGEGRLKSQLEGRDVIFGLVSRLDLGTSEGVLAESAYGRFKEVLSRNFCRGRSVPRVASVCLYWAIRNSRTTPVMLIDIADVVKLDVFVLGKTFKKMLHLVYGDEKNVPFEPMIPEDIIRRLASKLEFYNDTENVMAAAVRIVQRMDRDWMMLGRKPAGICGSAIILAARMFNYRRTPLEVSFVAKVTTTTLKLRLDEFSRLKSAQMRIADFMAGEFPGTPDSHDPPAFYRQTKEYQEEMQKKKPQRKRKRPAIEGEDEESEPSRDGKEQRQDVPEAADAASQDSNTSVPQAEPSRIDAEGFAIPALPPRSRLDTQAGGPQTISEDDISEAVPTDEQDEVDALASKYGDVPLPGLESEAHEASRSSSQETSLAPGAKTNRKRLLGSSLKTPVLFDDEEEWTKEENEMAEDMMQKISNIDSEIWVAAAKCAGMRTQELMEELENMRPAGYQQNSLLDAPDVTEDEFADDPEVLNCLLSEQERKIKEQLWLNENKDWLRQQQEKEFKKKMAPVKKPRKQTARKPRIGEGQLTPASSAEEAAMEAASRRQISTKINYSALSNMAKRGPGSMIGSEVASQQTSRAGSDELSDSDSDDDDDFGLGHTQANGDDVDDGDEAVGADDDGANYDEGEPYNNETGGFGEDDY
ncbi:transcription factor TFIIIB subunit brf1 [Cytospora paraplurivora]|uniref:Transcription factor TFIIIB subunit brf1 n=1 Tax=Cytospora paraplurivora TaxID=2898453 RepID=A0AAN9YKM0_9PEZI